MENVEKSVENQHICARCGKPFRTHHYFRDDDAPEYCSFRCESAALFGKFGWGLKWFAVSLAWGTAIFALFVLVVRPLFAHAPVENPLAFGGLVAVLVAIIGILTVLLRRVSR